MRLQPATLTSHSRSVHTSRLQAGGTACAQLQSLIPAAPVCSRPAMGCVLSLPGAQVAGRSLRLFCSGTARVNGTKCDKSASTPAKQKSDLVTIKYVGPVNKGLLMRQGVMTVSDLTDRFHTEADAQADKMVRYLQVRPALVRQGALFLHCSSGSRADSPGLQRPQRRHTSGCRPGRQSTHLEHSKRLRAAAVTLCCEDVLSQAIPVTCADSCSARNLLGCAGQGRDKVQAPLQRNH